MSKKSFKSHAASGKAGGFGAGFGSATFGAAQSSVLSYIQEPLDYSLISDSNVVVAFKNLSKKDGTTKAKALEDLQYALSSSEQDVEDGVVEAWIKVFPRLSIDSARRVRQLAFTLNGHVCSRCGKRIARHLPRLVGPWLAGMYDVDRSASRAAHDALQAVFPSPEKIEGLKRAFQSSILEYCRDALLNETPQTLSDERTVNADDAAATYARVVSSSLAVVSNLLQSLPSNEHAKNSDIYLGLLGDSRLWQFASHADATVRRAMHKFVRTCAQEEPGFVQKNLKTVSTAYIYKGLPSDQSSSALEFVSTLESLTILFPTIWTDNYDAKRPALSRLRTCLKNGSHGGTAEFWYRLSTVFEKLPSAVLPVQTEEVIELLQAARAGANQRMERFNAHAAWSTYICIAALSLKSVSSDGLEAVIDTCVKPLVMQFVCPSDANLEWAITGPKSSILVARSIGIPAARPFTEKIWPELVDKVIEGARLSQPEQSSHFTSSQKSVAQSGSRLSDVQSEIYRLTETEAGDPLHETLSESSGKLVEACIALLKNRNGKPYGAAAIIEEQLRTCGPRLMLRSAFHDMIVGFISRDLPALFDSPSRPYLAKCLHAVDSDPAFADALAQVMEKVLQNEDADSKLKSLHALFTTATSSSTSALGRDNARLQEFLAGAFDQSGDSEVPSILSGLITAGVVRPEIIDQILSRLTETLTLEEDNLPAKISTIEQLASKNRESLKEFMSAPQGAGSQLLPNVLILEQSADDDVSRRAAALSAKLTSTMDGMDSDARYSSISQNLGPEPGDWLPIDAVLELSDRLTVNGSLSEATLRSILPSIDTWRQSLLLAMNPPKMSLGIVSPLGGAVLLVKPDTPSSNGQVEYDSEGMGQAFRIAIYVAHLLRRIEGTVLSSKLCETYLAHLRVASLLAEDNLSIFGANSLWRSDATNDLEDEVMGFLSETSSLFQIHHTLDADPHMTLSSPLSGALSELKAHCPPESAMAYYVAYSRIRDSQSGSESSDSNSDQISEVERLLKSTRSSGDVIALVGCIIENARALTASPALARLCNELIADLTAIDISAKAEKGLEILVTLNAILSSQEDIIAGVAKSRVVFLAKHIIPWVMEDIPLSTKAETCRTISHILPSMADLYGDHWSQLFAFLRTLWNSEHVVSDGDTVSESGVLLLNTSLKVLSTLHRLLKSEDVNEDLIDAEKESQIEIRRGLVEVLRSAAKISDQEHEPLRNTNELLKRLILRSPEQELERIEDLYPVLYAPSHALQGAASEILRKAIVATQEQVSFEAALDNKTARLPDALVSLLDGYPSSVQTIADDRGAPSSTALRGFLLSWRLALSHFDGSSYRVKGDYVEQLKQLNLVSRLLDTVFERLGHTSGRPMDVSMFTAEDYAIDAESDPQRDMQWLLTHLFFLAMLNLPNLVQSYVRDVRSRQTSQAIEAWTAKYISPSIVTSSLQAVAAWGESSVKEDPDYGNMSVKVGMRSKEINVSYLVDEQTMAIKIVLPDTYPLESAKVLSVNRVAVKEEKWQSWLRNCQGVITFSNGSIIDGLSAWRKNVTGALKGQTECAICYSIISGDKQLPTKRCPTCKNLFHSSCLYKWFKTSNASTCPLCRNPFNFN